MAKEFKSFSDFEKIMKPILKDIIQIVGKKAEDKIKDYIESEVYSDKGNYYHDGSGNRTGEFKESWSTSKPKSTVNGYEVEVFSDKNKMRTDSDTFLHGSNYYSSTDIRDFLGEIINEGLVGNLFGSGFWTEKRPFWDKSVQELVDGGLIDKWIREEFKKRGFTLI